MLDLFRENEKFRSHANSIVEIRQKTIECSKGSDTFELYYTMGYCAALLVLEEEIQARQVFTDFVAQAQSLFVGNRQRIFDESQDFEQNDTPSIAYLGEVIDISGFVALVTQNNQWINSIDECIVDGEFVSPEGIKVYDSTFRLLEYSIKLNRDPVKAAKFRKENWDEWEEWDEVVNNDVDWMGFVAVENRDLPGLLDILAQHRVKSIHKLESGKFHPYTLLFTDYVLGCKQALALQLLQNQQKPDVDYPTYGIDLLV